jgi:hypothetical protein
MNSTVLLSLFYRVTPLDPVFAEVVDNIEQLQIPETQPEECLVRGIQIWTVIPGATSAVKHNGLSARQRRDAPAKLLYAFRTVVSTNVLGARDVRLQVQNPKADLEDEWFRLRGRFQFIRKILGLYEI